MQIKRLQLSLYINLKKKCIIDQLIKSELKLVYSVPSLDNQLVNCKHCKLNLNNINLCVNRKVHKLSDLKDKFSWDIVN